MSKMPMKMQYFPTLNSVGHVLFKDFLKALCQAKHSLCEKKLFDFRF